MQRSSWARAASLLALTAWLASANDAAGAGQLLGPYVDPAYYLSVPFGAHSHWAQPWRAYLETVPASVFVDGTGINFNVDGRQAENIAAMLARHGIHRARVEISWGAFDYNDESRLSDASMAGKLAILRRNGIRPLILLNANSSRPCPIHDLRKTIAADASAGSRTLEFTNADGIVPGYTGLSNLGPYLGAARMLVTALDGNTVTLSQPLPFDVHAGAAVSLATLKYRPFGAPGSADLAATTEGWQRYAVNVARIARAALGTTGQRDGGFDLEVWNELTFGSEFLSINRYYSPPLAATPNDNAQVWKAIVAATAATARARPDLFSGVLIGDGFANTIPWPASETEPDRVSALDKHPYHGRANFPANDQKGPNLNAAFQPDSFVPTYTANFPEFYATAIKTETLVRDMGPLTGSLYGTHHGRFARVLDGRPSPMPVWITEVNTSPDLDDPSISAGAAQAIKAKTTARYFCFFLNKGATQLDLYAARSPDTGLGIVSHNFLDYAQSGAPYPANEAPYLSPALLVTGRIVDQMKAGLDRNLTSLRSLHVNALGSRSDGVIFKGDGTALHPDLRAVDVFAFLPFQVNAHRFVIPFYVMTRDVMTDWPDDRFTIVVSGLAPNARFAVYDPFSDKRRTLVPLRSANGTRLELSATDYPRLLVVDERSRRVER